MTVVYRFLLVIRCQSSYEQPLREKKFCAMLLNQLLNVSAIFRFTYKIPSFPAKFIAPMGFDHRKIVESFAELLVISCNDDGDVSKIILFGLT